MSRHAPSASIETLRGVGPALRDKFAKLRIHTLLDLLLNLPHRYQDRTQVVPLIGLRANAEALVIGQVMESRVVFGNRRSWLVTLGDDTGFLRLRFFHFSERQRAAVSTGMYLRCFGEVRAGPNGFEMVHPEYKAFPTKPDAPEPKLTPVYPTTEGLTQTRLAGLVDQALDALDQWVPPNLDEWLSRDDAPDLRSALRLLHNPPTGTSHAAISAARNRVVLDELISNIIVLKRRQRERATERTLALPRSQQLGRVLLKRLGFELTSAQRRVTHRSAARPRTEHADAAADSGRRRQRQDVIAAFAAVRAAEHGCQTAIMAPTEILAEQHYLNFSSWLEPLGVSGAPADWSHDRGGTHARAQSHSERRSAGRRRHARAVSEGCRVREASRSSSSTNNIASAFTSVWRCVRRACCRTS